MTQQHIPAIRQATCPPTASLSTSLQILTLLVLMCGSGVWYVVGCVVCWHCIFSRNPADDSAQTRKSRGNLRVGGRGNGITSAPPMGYDPNPNAAQGRAPPLPIHGPGTARTACTDAVCPATAKLGQPNAGLGKRAPSPKGRRRPAD